MQNRRAGILPVLAAVLASILVSCATVQVPARQKSEDCLVILPCKLINSSNLESPRYYELSFSNGEANVRLPKVKNGFAWVVTHQSGEFISGLNTGIEGQRTSFQGNSASAPIKWPLPYEAGKAVVWDGVFVQSFKMTSDNAFSTDFDIVKGTPEEKAALLQELRDDGKLEGWD